MGCFCINGYVSHLPIIEGDKCFALIGLFDKSRLCDDICSRFSPFIPIALPIFGEYNDYGSLENITKDNNVEIIEKFFKKDIESILSNPKDIIDDDNIKELFNYQNSSNKEISLSVIIDHSFIYDEISNMANFIDLEGAYEVSKKTFDAFTKYYDKDYYDHKDFLKDYGYVDGKMFFCAESCYILCNKETDYRIYRPLIHPYFYHVGTWNDDKYELYLYRKKDTANYLMNNMKDEYLKYVNFNENSKFYGLKYFPNTSSSQSGSDDVPAISKLINSINNFINNKLKELNK